MSVASKRYNLADNLLLKKGMHFTTRTILIGLKRCKLL